MGVPLLRALLADLRDAIAPARCFLCGAPSPAAFACERHGAWLSDRGLAGARCGACLAPLGAGIPDGAPCPPCRRQGSPLAGGVALAEWQREGGEDGAGQWVLALKYGGRRDVARPLGAALGTALVARLADEAPHGRVVLVPIPLHPLRKLERGYDQAFELARHAARAADVDLERALVRTRRTAPQGSAFAPRRGSNVRDAFAPAPRRGARRDTPWDGRLRGTEVWLVDDVVSSAATAAEAARVCLRLGARRARLLIVARGGRTRVSRTQSWRDGDA